jgi:hypothetical protein
VLITRDDKIKCRMLARLLDSVMYKPLSKLRSYHRADQPEGRAIHQHEQPPSLIR